MCWFWNPSSKTEKYELICSTFHCHNCISVYFFFSSNSYIRFSQVFSKLNIYLIFTILPPLFRAKYTAIADGAKSHADTLWCIFGKCHVLGCCSQHWPRNTSESNLLHTWVISQDRRGLEPLWEVLPSFEIEWFGLILCIMEGGGERVFVVETWMEAKRPVKLWCIYGIYALEQSWWTDCCLEIPSIFIQLAQFLSPRPNQHRIPQSIML